MFISLRNNYFFRLLASLFFYWPLYILTKLIKRNKKIWLITCPYGFSDNSKYFYLYYYKYLRKKKNIRLIWFSQKKEETFLLRKLGFKDIATKYSLKGIWLSLRAKVYISSSGLEGFYKFLSGNVYIVNLWHGIGIKNLGLKGEIEPTVRKILSAPLSKIIYPSFYRKSNLFLTTSHLMKNHFMECFNLDESNVFISDYPRCLPLTMEKESLIKHIQLYENKDFNNLVYKIKRFCKAFIYMPTWRDDNPNIFEEEKINWNKINTDLKLKNYILLVKLHPLQSTNTLNNYSNIIILNSTIDVYPLLNYTD